MHCGPILLVRPKNPLRTTLTVPLQLRPRRLGYILKRTAVIPFYYRSRYKVSFLCTSVHTYLIRLYALRAYTPGGTQEPPSNYFNSSFAAASSETRVHIEKNSCNPFLLSLTIQGIIFVHIVHCRPFDCSSFAAGDSGTY